MDVVCLSCAELLFRVADASQASSVLTKPLTMWTAVPLRWCKTTNDSPDRMIFHVNLITWRWLYQNGCSKCILMITFNLWFYAAAIWSMTSLPLKCFEAALGTSLGRPRDSDISAFETDASPSLAQELGG